MFFSKTKSNENHPELVGKRIKEHCKDKKVLNIIQLKSTVTMVVHYHWLKLGGLDCLFINADILKNGNEVPIPYTMGMHVISDVDTNSYWIGKVAIYGDQVDNGFGTILMNELFKFAKSNSISYINGRMTAGESDEHVSRLRHYYKKFGFKIDGYDFKLNL